MKLPKELTTVSPVSKFLAFVVFVTFPFLGFIYGMKYQELVDFNKFQEASYAIRNVKRLPTPTPDPTANWKTYENQEYNFQFKYPSTYENTGKPEDLSRVGLIALDSFNNSDKTARIDVYLDSNEFSLDNLKHYAPTDGMKPIPEIIGKNTFYYYGPGGGGVEYPDQYFFDLKDHILYFIFSGPYINDKTPSQETKNLEKEIFSTFKFTY